MVPHLFGSSLFLNLLFLKMSFTLIGWQLTPALTHRYLWDTARFYMQRRSMWVETRSSRARLLKAFQSRWCSVPWSNLCSLSFFSGFMKKSLDPKSTCFWFHSWSSVLYSKEHYLIYYLLLFLWKQKSGGGPWVFSSAIKEAFPSNLLRWFQLNGCSRPERLKLSNISQKGKGRRKVDKMNINIWSKSWPLSWVSLNQTT